MENLDFAVMASLFLIYIARNGIRYSAEGASTGIAAKRPFDIVGSLARTGSQ